MTIRQCRRASPDASLCLTQLTINECRQIQQSCTWESAGNRIAEAAVDPVEAWHRPIGREAECGLVRGVGAGCGARSCQCADVQRDALAAGVLEHELRPGAPV